MARTHANVQIGIWDDPDFRALSPDAQLLYLQLLSSSTLNYAGVADWRPNRIAMLSAGRTSAEVEAAMTELEAGLFVIVDDVSEEAFVRSFFKWDGLLQKPNVAKAMIREWGEVHSLDLRAVIVHELRKLKSRFPEWRAIESGVIDELLANPSLDPAEMVRRRVPETLPGRDAPLPTTYYPLPATDNQQPTTHSPAAEPRDIEHIFDTAYASWPKKVERKKSLDAFKRACKKRDPEDLAADIARFGQAYAATTETQFVPALVVWLNGERWTDQLPQARASQSTAHERQYQRQQANLAVIHHFEAIETDQGAIEA